jgi:27-O-demethylrifamycin SV methyltransferase
VSAVPVFTPASRIRFWFNALLYNSITDAWKYILGENFHWGYFSSPDVSLADATDALIDQMAALGNFSAQTKILDVGCGVGNPAFYLHRKFGCDITGISISEKGVYQAEEESKKRGYQEKVRFRVANALDNGFDDNAFDIAWVMESSHLMKDKKKLFAECYRVLKPGGLILLCDIMLRRSYTAADLLDYLRRLKLGYFSDSVSFIRSFGTVRMETFEFYQNTARDAGFDDVKFVDISEQVEPTIDCWRGNIAANKRRILETISPSQIKSFIQAIELSTASFEMKLGGYGILKASKR